MTNKELTPPAAFPWTWRSLLTAAALGILAAAIASLVTAANWVPCIFLALGWVVFSFGAGLFVARCIGFGMGADE